MVKTPAVGSVDGLNDPGGVGRLEMGWDTPWDAPVVSSRLKPSFHDDGS